PFSLVGVEATIQRASEGIYLESTFYEGPIESAPEILTGIVRTIYQTMKVLNIDRKSTRLNSSHVSISYAVFCLKKKTKHYYGISFSPSLLSPIPCHLFFILVPYTTLFRSFRFH